MFILLQSDISNSILINFGYHTGATPVEIIYAMAFTGYYSPIISQSSNVSLYQNACSYSHSFTGCTIGFSALTTNEPIHWLALGY